MQMMAPVYGLAEQAADLIKSQYGGAPMTTATNSTSGPGSKSGTSPSGGKSPVQTEQGNEDGNGSPNGAAFMKPSVGLSLLALVAGAFAML